MEKEKSRIRLNEPARSWAEGFPLGSGRIGAMVWGSPGSEIVSFNHDLLWRACYDGPAVRFGEKAETIRELCLAGRYREADEVLRTVLPDQRGVYINPFVPFCDLYLNLLLPDGKTEEYIRELDLEHGTVRVSYLSGGIRYGYECFCSYRYGAFLLRAWSSRPAALSGEISLFRMPDSECVLEGSARYRELRLDGCFDEGKRFSAAVKIANRGGRTLIGRRSCSAVPEKSVREAKLGLSYSFDRDEGIEPDQGPSLIFDSCNEIVIALATAVDDEAEDPAAYARETLSALAEYETVLAEHAADFAALFGRTRLFLGDGPEEEQLELQYDTARYLAISAGRPQPPDKIPKAPVNLQGIWCRDTRPAWESDYHTDLNIQMCYWPMAQAGLPEWYEPLLLWAERLLPQAEERARDLYGKDGAAWNGCCDPHILGGTDNVGYGFLGAGAWILQILCLYPEYAPSDELQKRLLRLMVPTARLLDEMLVTREDGTRTFPFGSSPEMALIADGQVQWLGSASVCDLLLTKELFAAVNEYRLVEEGTGDPLFDPDSVRGVLRNGKIGEWTEDHTENEPGHRHRSPFVCFCPGNSVTAEREPEITAALSDLLDRRLAAGSALSTSFSHVWDAQILARLHRGEEAYGRLRELFRIHLLPNGLLTTNDWKGAGGIGWFSGVKVIQIDASLGLISAVTELFYQDRNGPIELLPACPPQLSSGRMTGVRGRGGFLTDFKWKDGHITSVTVRSLRGEDCAIRMPGCRMIRVNGREIEGNGVFSFPAEAGGVYEIFPCENQM